MSRPKQTRWVCPACGNGKLAPTRPRRDDVRRYCIPCSEKTGRLVERVAPALERKREQSRARSQTKAQAKAAKTRARERAKTHVRLADAAGRTVEIDPIETAREIYRKLGWRYAARASMTWNRRHLGHWSGRAWPSHIHMGIAEDKGVEGYVTLVLHEGAHVETTEGVHHGPAWVKKYMDGADKLLGLHVYLPGVQHRYRDTDPRVEEAAAELSRKSKTPIVGRALSCAST